MLSFLARRFASSVVVMFVASYLVYVLTAYSNDPLAQLRLSNLKGKQQLIEQMIAQQHLDVSPFLRYFIWFDGLLKGFTGHFDLGLTTGGQTVSSQLGSAMGATLQLLFGATIIAIIFGVGIGIVTALRQYTAFDYGTTFVSFLFFSLPVVWLAVLLKQYLAINFNNFLGTGTIHPGWMFGIAAVLALLGASIVESYRRRAMVFAGVFVVVAGALAILSATKWFTNPQLTIAGVAVLSLGGAVGITALTAGIENKKALYSALTTAGVGIALYYPLKYTAFTNMSLWLFIVLALVAIGVGALVGWLWGGPDRNISMRTAGMVALVTSAFVAVDRFLQGWQTYSNSTYANGRPIATIGSISPNFQGDFWFNGLDHFTHLLLPTVALMLASLASYSRYARASMLEVMNQDYIRTARSKGLTERVVVMRHAFRNALIPVVTIVTLDFGALIGGTLVTENVFSFQGMGNLFETALGNTDVNSVMGFFLVTGVAAITFNLIADVIYTALDPRIRVTA
jgi:peptide/nickel transport system permease protein